MAVFARLSPEEIAPAGLRVPTDGLSLSPVGSDKSIAPSIPNKLIQQRLAQVDRSEEQLRHELRSTSPLTFEEESRDSNATLQIPPKPSVAWSSPTQHLEMLFLSPTVACSAFATRLQTSVAHRCRSIVSCCRRLPVFDGASIHRSEDAHALANTISLGDFPS